MCVHECMHTCAPALTEARRGHRISWSYWQFDSPDVGLGTEPWSCAELLLLRQTSHFITYWTSKLFLSFQNYFLLCYRLSPGLLCAKQVYNQICRLHHTVF